MLQVVQVVPGVACQWYLSALAELLFGALLERRIGS